MPILVDATPTQAGTGLDLCDLWLNVASNLADCQAFTYVSGMAPSTGVRVEVRELAGGRRRAVRRAGRGRAYTWNLTRVTRPQVHWLEDHAGVLMCIRDDRGRKWYGLYDTAGFDEPNWTKDRASISLTLVEVTHTEAV